jgi:hypothetical protein
LCEEALGLGATPRAIYKALDLEPPPPFRKFDADQPRVSAGNGRESGRWTSGAGGAAGGVSDVSGAAVREGRSVSPAGSSGVVPAAASETPNPGEPVPVVLNNGTMAQNPRTHGPLLQPAGVSLAQNAKIGEALSLLPTKFSTPPGDPAREAAMAALFLPGWPMDYQRVYSVNGKINPNFIDFGNYNYGAVAAAAGYTREQVLLGAGVANLLGSGKKDGPMFNNPKNIPFINAGYDDYKAGLIGSP